MSSQLILASLEPEGGEHHLSTAEAAEGIFEGIASFHFTFESALLCLSLLLISSIVFDRLGAKVGMPGSIFLFFCGLFFHISGYNFELFPIEELHVVALCILLFFSGLSFEGSLLRKNKVLPNSIYLALFGTL